jgi:hypothetical protein
MCVLGVRKKRMSIDLSVLPRAWYKYAGIWINNLPEGRHSGSILVQQGILRNASIL